MIKRMVIMLVLVAVVLGGVFGFKDFVNGKIKEFMTGPAGPGHQAQTVSTVKAGKSEWLQQIQVVGSLRAVRGADLALELPGVVDRLYFQSGDDVEEGKELMHLHDEDDVAKLQSLEALADLSQVNYDRDLKQFKAQAVSQAVVDTDAANLKNNRAQVEQQRAIVNKKKLKAPFSGRLGLRQVDLGQYLAAGTVVVTLQALTPIYADFFLPQQQIAKIHLDEEVSATVDAFPGQTFKGKITAINPKVESGSRNVQVRATLDNPDRKLLPGMFATITVTTGAPQQLITLPQTAISYNAYGDLVYIVDDKKGPDGKPQLTARQTFVTVGATRGDQVSILKGIDEGTTVVTGGQMKLRNGVPVAINNSIQPKNDANPKPVDQ